MKKIVTALGTIACLVFVAAAAGAQDYRARVQGAVVDASQGALPGATVTLPNDATGVAVTVSPTPNGRYLFDFVDPGIYTVIAELQGFKKAEQRNVRVQQRANLTVDLTLSVGGVEERSSSRRRRSRCSSTAPAPTSRSSSSSSIRCRSPAAIRTTWRRSIRPSRVSPATNENRPYHHAYANDYDAGGGTRAPTTCCSTACALGASFKTAYTPAVDAVEEITVSKNSVDAENGHSLGGIISLNMKSGTNRRADRLLLRPRSRA